MSGPIGAAPASRSRRSTTAAASENPDITFGKVDSEAHPQLSSALGVQAIPTLMVFRDGIGLFRQAGALPKAALDDLISQARALDMDQVRASIAEQPQA